MVIAIVYILEKVVKIKDVATIVKVVDISKVDRENIDFVQKVIEVDDAKKLNIEDCYWISRNSGLKLRNYCSSKLSTSLTSPH